MAKKTHEIRVDLSKPLSAQPDKGHNRWHPRIPPVISLNPGEEAVIETIDACDGQFSWDSNTASVTACDLNRCHVLTGPVWVNGAEEGDLLEVELLDITPSQFGWTGQVPGFSFLRDLFPEPFLVRWRLDQGHAESPDLPGVRIPEASFPGVIGVSPSETQLQQMIERERRTAARGGVALPPDPREAVPAQEPMASQGLRTVPPRETGGNIDVKHLTRGTRVYLPVWTQGALFSIGDAHYAQGDGEVCGTAIEMAATFHLRFHLHKGAARARRIRSLQFEGTTVLGPPRRYYATTGLCLRGEVQESEDATLAARNAMLAMIDYLEGRGFTRQQAYAICSVAVDLKISELVDVPNYAVSAYLPLDILT